MPAMASESGENGYVGLVLVSHSASIADGVAELVGQIAGPGVPIVAIGGTADGSLGTDGGKVLEALREAAAGSGAVVLMDLGSSVLAVRAAQEELSAAEHERVLVADAPLVEGAVAAGATASMGATAAEIATAAEGARSAAKL
jgi:phosphoenolpyruvate---glycerone phosphotransferase subunit DhaM